MNDTNVNTNDYCIVVMSCDSYRDAWPHFGYCWDLFWPNCPFDTYLISETIDFHHHSIKNIKIGQRVCWSDMLITVLDQLPHKHVIYMQEDYLLKSETIDKKLAEKLSVYEKENAVYFRLIPWPSTDQLLEPYDDIGVINKNSEYRTSLQCAVWDKNFLQSILIPGESGWDFEFHSVSRSSSTERPFLGLSNNVAFADLNNGKYPIDYFASGILNGKWMRECLYLFRNKGIKINPGKRGVLSRWDYFYYQYRKEHQNRLFDLLNKYIFRKSLFNIVHYYFLLFFRKV